MAGRELRVERLLTCRVVDGDGAPVGPIEEVRVEVVAGRTCVVEYRIGAYAILQRLAGSAFRQALLRSVGAGREGGGYVVPWDRMDLSDPSRPRLRCRIDELRRVGGARRTARS